MCTIVSGVDLLFWANAAFVLGGLLGYAVRRLIERKRREPGAISFAVKPLPA